MDRFEAMRTLLAAVDGGSLSAASRRLRVPLPTVSRRVSDLEAHLRTQLVVRTSRRLLLTDAGRGYVAACRQILEELDDAERLASGEYRTPRGALLVTAPVLFGRLHVQPVVLDFLAVYPEISLRLMLSDATIDIVEERVDLALRIGALPDSGLVARRLGEVRWIVCASPDYLGRRGTPTTPHDLVDHDCIGFDRLGGDSAWPFAIDGRTHEVAIRPRFSVSTASGALDAALAGAGVVRVLSYQASAALADGWLVKLLDRWETAPLPVHLLHNPQPILPLKLRALIDFAAPRLRDRLATVQDTQAAD